MIQISTVIIARDEEARLERCVRPCLSFSREVVVVDGGSHDRTREVARQLGCNVLENPWPGYSAQRNIGAAAAMHDWIFSVDADEVVDDELERALAEIGDESPPAYSVLRVNAFLGEPMIESPEVKVRLYDRRRARFTDALVHEVVDVDPAEAPRLPGSLRHERPATVAEAMQRLNVYTSLEADIAARERPMRLWRLVLRPPLRFAQRYLLQRAILHGWRGLFFALYWAYWELLREMKVWERRRRCGSSS